MKKILNIQVILAACLLASCNFLNVEDYFEDTFNENNLFTSKHNIERYYNGAVTELPFEGRPYYWCWLPGPTGSDEAVTVGSYNNGYLMVDFPGQRLTTDLITYNSMGGWEWNFNVWDLGYKIVRKINTILPNIDKVPDMNTFEKAEFRAECRFLRAYAYYLMLMNQGPLILLGDDVKETNESPEYYKAYRNTYDECIDYICSEFEAAAEHLKVTQPLDMFGRPTKGAALGLVARLRLQAASPLFNGGDAARKYYGEFTRSSDGVHYISQTYDESKWAVAAAAAKRVIDMGVYELHTVEADEFTLDLPANVPSAPFPNGAGGIDPFRSYAEMFNGETTNYTNPELIWGTTANFMNQLDVVFPRGLGGNSTISIPQRIVDSYYMADGRDINEASAQFPYEARPYDPTCVTQGDKYLSRHYILKGGTYKAFDNREPRFYASIAFSGALWPFESSGDNSKKNVVVKYHNGSPQGKENSSTYNITGYGVYKWTHPRDARDGSSGSRMITKTYPFIRYAEILLSYAEALNNLTTTHTIDGETYSRNLSEIEWAFNQIRYRAGLPGVSTAELNPPEQFQELIVRERMIEFLHENRRYYDVCRWGIYEELEREPLTGMNVDLAEWSGFYQPTVIQHRSIRERVFKPKYMLLPLHRNELRKVPTLDQNPGWES